MVDVTISEAAGKLKAGEVVAFATETVYGLGADATNPAAVARIFATKGRPDFNPLICHIADLAQLDDLVMADARARRLAEAFWPGALTLVLPRRPDCPVAPAVSAGLPSLALRMPAHPQARELLRLVGRPVAAPSANRSGHVSPTTAQHVRDSLGPEVPVLDGGPCPVGLESTVIGLTGPQATLLRPGGVAAEEIERVLGETLARPTDVKRESPGMLLKHYAPRLPVRLEATAAQPGKNEGLLSFGPPPPGFTSVWRLSDAGDLAEAAANLYAGLHALDHAPGLDGIAVMPIPPHGLGQAINDRLTRAARGR
ncbi:L-threonylcarbamoyladenylate synthase [Ferrovibrio sp.]|uniref:L-threonylcarbamoyladenylate synthase n=1 Tax=Ferrovibrio sp. TaxID=1917215 RepID=UPI002603DD58|nr:L-threonylcarbamoyladenylate synthase [Ferrovibrio sp.]